MKQVKSPSEDALTEKKPRSRKPWLWAIGLLILLLLGILLVGILLSRPAGEPVIPDTPGMAMVAQMGPGLNFSHALECFSEGADGVDSETLWGSPATTREMLEAVKAAGFTTLRLPVTWSNHLDAQDNVDPAWMDRVQEVVDYAYDLDFFVILNAHHEDYYGYVPDKAHEAGVTAQYTKLWAQIAARFRDYGERLLFEAINEPRVNGSMLEWGGGTASQRNVINRLHAAFVNTVRESGGNNAGRWLLLPTHAASREPRVMRALRLPDDDRLIVSVHLYYPGKFTGTGSPDVTQYTDKDRLDIDKTLGRIYDCFVKRGVPVYLGEFAAADKHNEAERARYATDFTAIARRYGMRCAWWDDATTAETTITGAAYGLLDRRTLQWFFPEIAAALVG